jgi:hypothetical protein
MPSKACDQATGAVNTIEHVHHEIHDGCNFDHTDVVDLSVNNVRDVQIITNDTTKWAHLAFSFKTESETDWYFYEGVNIVTEGTRALPFNNDRNVTSKSTPESLTLRYIDNTTTANANLDTSTAGARTLEHGISGAGKDAGELGHGHEIILRQNEDYCLRFIATAAGYVTYHITWYEHVNR